MTIAQARELAELVWSVGNAIGVVQRGSSIGFAVGCCYVDGRKAEVKGRSQVDWESAFMNAAENDTSACARITQVIATRKP